MVNVRALLVIVIGSIFFGVAFVFLRYAVGLSMPETFAGIFAFSGWAAILYGYISDSSSIRANLLYVFDGVISFPAAPDMASYTAYIYLVNSGKNPVHLLDCELDVKIKGRGWVILKRVYGKAGSLPITFGGNPEKIISIAEDEVIFHKNKLLQLGVPLYGWANFVGEKDLVCGEIVSYRLVCIDAYGRRHTIKKNVKSLVNYHLALELAGVRMPMT